MRLVKLSTAAAVAAGLATSASAVELSEAIKGVDVSGYVRYRMEMFGEEANEGDGYKNNTHKYKLRTTTTIPVNDQVNAVLMVGAGEAALDDTGNNPDGDGEYGNADFSLMHAYFQYTGVENLTVQAGKQPLPTPFNDDEHGNGIVALYNAGPVTLAGGAFDSSNARGDYVNDIAAGVADNTADNIMAVGAIGAVEMVNFSAWYAQHQDMFDAYTLAADADVLDGSDMTVNVGARYTALSPEDDLEEALDTLGSDQKNTNSLLKVHADMQMNNIFAGVSYAKTDKDGGLVGYNTDAATGYQLENLTIFDKADTDAYKIGGGMTFGKLTASLDYMAYTDESEEKDQDGSELLPKVAYKMSDNFNVALFHSMVTEDDYDPATDKVTETDFTETQLELKYTF